MDYKKDIRALALAILVVGAMALYRGVWVEPRAWGAACLDLSAAGTPLACWPRAGLVWLQHWGLWGLGALALGVWSFLGAPRAVRAAAVALGLVALLNHNATYGVLGAWLGAWAWARALAAGRTAGGGERPA